MTLGSYPLVLTHDPISRGSFHDGCNNWGQGKVIFTMALGLARLFFGFHWTDVMSIE